MEPKLRHLFIKEHTLVDKNGVKIEKYDNDVQQIKRKISVIGRGLKLSLSSIPKSGFGVFANRNFEKDEVITFYDGSVAAFTPPKELLSKYRSHARKLTGEYTLYGNYLPGIGLIDSANDFQRENYLPGTGGGAWMNDQEAKKENNGVWFSFETKSRRLNPFGDTNPFRVIILIVATKLIQKNEEIFINYGQDYWGRVGNFSNGTKEPVFITQSQYEAKEKEEAERKKKNLKRLTPIMVIPNNDDDDRNKRTKLTSPCFRCQKMTQFVDLETEIFLCSSECLNVVYPTHEKILCLL